MAKPARLSINHPFLVSGFPFFPFFPFSPFSSLHCVGVSLHQTQKFLSETDILELWRSVWLVFSFDDADAGICRQKGLFIATRHVHDDYGMFSSI